MSVTSDRNDPRLTRGDDETPVDQAEVYLVLSDEERAKGFVRPVRRSYVHVGNGGPQHPTRELTPDEHNRYDRFGYLIYEEYPAGGDSLGRFWTRETLDAAKACGALTTMGTELAETYARDPKFYGGTYCTGCRMHRPVAEFVWDGTTEVVGS